jgi:hypothetical protein
MFYLVFYKKEDWKWLPVSIVAVESTKWRILKGARIGAIWLTQGRFWPLYYL